MADAPVSVLVIDDNEVIAQLAAEFLESAGYHVVVAATGGEGLLIALRDPFGVIVCDAMMPDINGREILRRLRDHQPTKWVPFVLISGSHEAESWLGPGDLFLLKPFTMKELVEAVDTMKSRARAPLPEHPLCVPHAPLTAPAPLQNPTRRQ